MKKFSIVICIAFFAMFLLSLSVVVAGNRGNEAFLGDYIQYGLICKLANFTGDSETSILCDELHTNGQTIGNTDKAGAPGIIKASKIVGNVQLHNKNTQVIEDKSVSGEISDLLGRIKDYSLSVADKNDVQLSEVSDQNAFVIDITSEKADTVYVQIGDTLSQLQNGALKLKKRQGQTIILNSEESETFKIPRYRVVCDDDDDIIAQTVIWNLPYANNVEVNSDGMTATVIAPSALVNINVTMEGWLVCDTLVSNGAEIHFIYQGCDVETVETVAPSTATPIKGRATDNPKATDKPRAIPKPKKTETPKVTATPEKAVTTPEVTTTPNPVVTEIPAPTETPTSTGTPVPTATVAPTSSPAVVKIKDSKTPKDSKVLTDATPKPTAKANSESNVTIKDNITPLSDGTPDTGDDSNLLLAIVAGIISLFLIFASICWIFIFSQFNEEIHDDEDESRKKTHKWMKRK